VLLLFDIDTPLQAGGFALSMISKRPALRLMNALKLSNRQGHRRYLPLCWLSQGRIRDNYYAVLFLAVVDEAGDFTAQVFAVDNHIDKAVLHHKLGRLEALRQFYLDGLGDSPRAGETD
jgi:hypothetical protein